MTYLFFSDILVCSLLQSRYVLLGVSFVILSMFASHRENMFGLCSNKIWSISVTLLWNKVLSLFQFTRFRLGLLFFACCSLLCDLRVMNFVCGYLVIAFLGQYWDVHVLSVGCVLVSVLKSFSKLVLTEHNTIIKNSHLLILKTKLNDHVFPSRFLLVLPCACCVY